MISKLYRRASPAGEDAGHGHHGALTLKIREPHVITVTGKAFYDIGHAPADHSNRRSKPEGYAVWEIHPVMALHVDQ
jgi:hypothetical protein